MKRIFGMVAFLLALTQANAQTIVVTDDDAYVTGQASSVLDIKSTEKGILIPRMTAAQRNAISSPATGLMVYQTDGTSGFYYYNGSGWLSFAPETGSANIATVGTITSGTWNGTAVGPVYGGTGIASYTLGDILYGSGTNTLAKLSGNTTTSKRYLTQTGNGSVSAAPSWGAITASDLPTAIDAANLADGSVSNSELQFLGTVTSNVQTQLNAKAASGANTDITSITGSAATLTTSRSIYGNSFNGSADITTAVGPTFGGTGQSTYTLGDLLYSSASNTLSKLGGNTTTSKRFLTQTGTGSASAAPSWGALAASDMPTAIDAANLADGSVSNSELQFLGTVTSNVQTQLNAKAASGANTDITSVSLNQTGLTVKGATSTALTIRPNETLTSARTLNIVTGDADRTVTLGGNITTAGALTTSGANALTLTTTGATNVTLPTTGTLVSSAVTTLSSLASVGTITTGTWNGTAVGPTFGGTGQSTYTLGDILYSSASNTLSKLGGNTTTSKRFLTQTGTGSASAAPSWGALAASDMPTAIDAANLADGSVSNSELQFLGTVTSNVQTQLNAKAASGANTDITSITGSAATLTTSRSIYGNSFNGSADITSAVGPTFGGTGQSTYTLGDLLYSSASNTLSKLGGNTTTTKQFLTQTGNGTTSAAPAWGGLAAGDMPSSIDATKIANGNVTNTEYQYLDGVSSFIQTQIDGKQPLGSYAASGANTDITSVLLNQTGLSVKGATATALTIRPNETLTSARTLNIVTGDADRTVTLGGNITTAGALTTSGANALTLTTTGATNVTLPTSGTLVNSAVTTLSSLASVGTITSGTWNGTAVGPTFGGTGQSTYTTGDILYSSAANTLSKLSGNTTTAKQFLTQTGTGSASAAPAWGPLAASDMPTGIDAADLADGSVSNTEFQHISTVTSNVQTQIDSKEPVWLTYEVASDVSTTGQTLVDVTGLVSATLSASTKYEFEAVLEVATSAVTTGTRYAVNISTAPTRLNYLVSGTVTSTTGGVTSVTANNTASGTAFLTTSSTSGIIVIRGIVSMNTAGTLAIRHLKVTSGTSTVRAGSILRIRAL